MNSWIENEFKNSKFADLRLRDRLLKMASTLAAGFGQSIPMACQDWAATKAAYRFIDNDRVTDAEILEGHFAATGARIAATEGPILVLHDTSEFSFTREDNKIGNTRLIRKNTGKNFVGGKQYFTKCGILMHATLAVTADGLPLGLGALKFWTRKNFKGTTEQKRHINPTRVPIEEKESFRWIENLNQSTNRFGSPDRLVHIADRESDMYEFFNEAKVTQSHFLVRICVNRRTTQSVNVYEQMKQQPAAGTYKITFTDETGKVIETDLEIKFKTVELQPSDGRKAKTYGPLKVNIVFAKEIGGRKKGRPLIDWKLVTDLPVTTVGDAIEKLRWYALRWRIEVFFKILKSGCKAEELKLREFERITNLISIYCVLGWRVFWLTMMNREVRSAPASLALTELEIKILDHLFPPKDKRSRKILSEYITKIARLGGYLARSSDPPPGNQVIWRGLKKLGEINLGVRIGLNFVGN